MNKVGSVCLKNMEITLASLVAHELITKETTVEELYSMCTEFSRQEGIKHNKTKLEQNYGKQNLEWR
jgi:hypothetical protein